MLLLMARSNGYDEIRVGVSAYMGEELHPLSQNKISIEIPPNINIDSKFITGSFDLTAAGMDGDSRSVAQLIGNPDFVTYESEHQMISRTYEEIRESQRRHKKAIKKSDREGAKAMDDLRLSLVEKMLRERYSTDRMFVTKRFGEKEILAHIDLGNDQYVLLPYTQEVADLIERYGGIDRDFTTEPYES